MSHFMWESKNKMKTDFYIPESNTIFISKYMQIKIKNKIN